MSESTEPTAQIDVRQEFGKLGKGVGVELGQVAGNVTVSVLQIYGTPPTEKRVHVPPAARYSIFGREPELAQILVALRERRTVMLYGLGGIGKTALAAEAARRLHAEAVFKDGILWVSEVGAAPAAAICDAVARHLGNEDILRLAPQAKLD